MCFLCSLFHDFFVYRAGHLGADSSVPVSAALARRRREIRMGKRPILSDGTLFDRLMNQPSYAKYLLLLPFSVSLVATFFCRLVNQLPSAKYLLLLAFSVPSVCMSMYVCRTTHSFLNVATRGIIKVLLA
jgi:hypothetical protein